MAALLGTDSLQDVIANAGQRLAEPVFAAPGFPVPGARIVLAQADAPDRVGRTGFHYRPLGCQQQGLQVVVLGELRPVAAIDDLAGRASSISTRRTRELCGRALFEFANCRLP